MGSAGLLARMDWRIVWASLGLVGVLLLGALIIGMVDRWRKRSASEVLSAGDQLSHFRRLYEQGTLTREEFERIRARLAEKLRDELKLRPQVPAEGPPSAEAPPPGRTPGPAEPPPDDPRPGEPG